MKESVVLSCKKFLFVAGLLLPCLGSAEQFMVEEFSGAQHLIEVQPEDSFINVVETICAELQAKDEKEDLFSLNDQAEPFIFEIKRLNRKFFIKAAKVQGAAKVAKTPREFYRNFTQNERQDLQYLLDFMANASLLKIASSKASLKKVVDRLNHLHPFQTLMSIVNDDELNRYIHKIRDRSWVWEELYSEFTSTLDQENALHNLMPYIYDFASGVNLDVIYLMPLLQSEDWHEFFEVLLETHPV